MGYRLRAGSIPPLAARGNCVLKSILLLIVGAIIGIAVSQVYSGSLRKEITFLQQANSDLEARSVQLQSDLNSAQSRSAGISAQTAKHCMLLSSIRSSAINNRVAGTTLSAVEEGEFKRLHSVSEQHKGSSSERLKLALIQESAKLDDECLGSGAPVAGG